MSEVLALQGDQPDTPEEEKGSGISVAFCHKSHVSIALCYVK